MESSLRQFNKGEGTISRQMTRVLVVGCADDAGVMNALGAMREGLEIVQAANFMAAMGELAMREVDVVIGGVSGLRLSAAAISKGLRRIAPNARLLLVDDCDKDDQRAASQALLSGFDAMLNLPLHVEDLHGQMFGEQAKAQLAQRQPAGLQEESGADVDRDVVDHAASKKVVTGEDEELGDVDLLDEIMAGGAGFKGKMLSLIRQQSGVTQMNWARATEDVPTDVGWAEVKEGGKVFGTLYARGLGRDEVQPWAAWAGKWCAMEDQVGQLKRMSMRDELTGIWNRRYFNRFLKRILERAEEDRSQVTLLVFDIDDFKRYNDQYGHAAGDEILKETARLMGSVVREHDVVARIGGDEFAVIFWDAEGKRRADSEHPMDVMKAARRFQKAVCKCEFPKLAEEAMGMLTVSGGLASYPWDGRSPGELLEKADLMALESKKQGKNAITMGRGVRHACADEK
ncbi:diguanylate cyclase [Poriferisphaera sp. WC338]|uniref:sensor domain-containing diguanylate cyclase n=1 Tax=Poriferisphaera sp. WC338 TaxID=3425129 RepID=UPI003D818950